MESPRIHVGQTGQRGKMNTLRASSIIRSGIGIYVIRFCSLRLICFNLGASFFSYAISFIGLGHNTFLSTAIYMSRLGQHKQWFMCPFLRLNSFLRKILNDSANSPVIYEKVAEFDRNDSLPKGRESFCFSMQYIRNSPVLGRLLLEKGKYEYKQIVCGYSHYVISC